MLMLRSVLAWRANHRISEKNFQDNSLTRREEKVKMRVIAKRMGKVKMIAIACEDSIMGCALICKLWVGCDSQMQSPIFVKILFT